MYAKQDLERPRGNLSVGGAVASRKSEIFAVPDVGSIQATARIMAAEQEITRGHLAAWDASVRAWLQTADEANRVRQTQLRLILDNISLPVNSQADLIKVF